MRNNNQFNIAFIVSLSVHFAALFPYSLPYHELREPPQLESLLVDYFVIEEILERKAEEPELPSLKLEEEVPPEERQAIAKEKKESAKEKMPLREEKRFDDTAESSLLKRVEAKIKEVAKRAKEDRHFNKYYKMVRDRIRSELRKNYKGFSEEGDVHLIFTLLSDGVLKRYRIDRSQSTSDKLLLEIAELSLIESSPFPQFPKELPQKQITFNVVVSFKER